jgi:CP family cyanate transporter-like MFS transporter
VLLAGGLVLIALNLRPALAAVPPLLGTIQRSAGLSSPAAGLLTTIPVICFGVFALATPALARRIGLARLLLVALVVLVGGVGLRLVPTTVALFAGTAVAGAAIAVANVTLPAVIKDLFPDRVALLTGLYSMALSAGAALAAGLTVPLRQSMGVGWRPALAAWGLLALLAGAVWAPHAGQRRVRSDQAKVRGLGRDRLARRVTAYMGLQSLVFYATLTWLPTLFSQAGMSAGRAGWMLSYASLVGIAGSLVAPVAMLRLQRPRLMVVLTGLLCALGLAGLVVAPAGLAYESTTLLGLGQGAAVALALTFIGLRSPDARHAAALSTMAQGAGYLVASVGPFGIGLVHDLAGGWDVPLIVLIALVGVEVLAGVGAAADGHVAADAGAAVVAAGGDTR